MAAAGAGEGAGPGILGEALRFRSLAAEPRLVHGISTRPWNVSFTAGAAHGDPREGRRRLLGSLGLDPAKAVVAGQVHGDHLAWVSARDAKAGAFVPGQAVPETDGLATSEPGVGLVVTAADCPPVLLWDSEASLVAAVHSGWRGTARRIVPKAVEQLCARGARPSRLRAGIGPGIGPCCYEVGAEVAEHVPAAFRGAVVRRGEGGSRRLDLPLWIERQLLESGVEPSRIERMPLCTACRTDLFFSHRAERGRCGRFGMAAAIRS